MSYTEISVLASYYLDVGLFRLVSPIVSALCRWYCCYLMSRQKRKKKIFKEERTTWLDKSFRKISEMTRFWEPSIPGHVGSLWDSYFFLRKTERMVIFRGWRVIGIIVELQIQCMKFMHG